MALDATTQAAMGIGRERAQEVLAVGARRLQQRRPERLAHGTPMRVRIQPFAEKFAAVVATLP